MTARIRAAAPAPAAAAVRTIALLVFLLVTAPAARAGITETRTDEANPVIAVFKSTLYGGGAGLLLGMAIELVDDGGDGEPIRWGFVAGTFFGFAYGIYHVSTRPEPHALLEGGAGGLALGVPDVRLVRRGTAPETVVLAGAHAPRADAGARLTLAAFRF